VERASENAATFNRTLAQLSERLAARDIVVSTLHSDWSCFGSWELQVQRGSAADRYHEVARLDPGHAIPPDVVRCIWDGREHYLMIETSPTRPLSAPNEWKEEYAKGFDTSDEAVQYLQGYLERRSSMTPPNRPNETLERTATRCAFTFQMIKTVSVKATLALGGGRSASLVRRRAISLMNISHLVIYLVMQVASAGALYRATRPVMSRDRHYANT
jgi:hypothetical protein